MSEEERLWKNRFAELAERAYARGRYAFTDFLSPVEAEYLHACEREVSYAGVRLWGGYEGAERQIARFGSCGYEEAFPIAVLKITPVSERFAEPLVHRDYLGSLTGLGIERNTLGDIRLSGGGAYVYCLDRIAPFIAENLRRVRHTDVKAEKTEAGKIAAGEKKSEFHFLSSLRADCAVAAVFSLSRTEAEKYFDAERVFVNGRLCARPSRELHEGDGVTVRGKGRFTFAETAGESRKGRLRVRVERDAGS